MKSFVKSMLVAVTVLAGATLLSGPSEAQTVRFGGGVVAVQDHGGRFHHRRGEYRGPRYDRRDHRRAYYRDRFHGGYRDRYYGGRSYYRDRRYHAWRHHGRDGYYFDRRHGRSGGVVIQLR